MSDRKPAQTQDRQPGLEDKMRPEPDTAPRHPGAGRLDGKVALITGGDSGIGKAVAIAFAREGADVAIAYLDEHQDAEATVQAVLDEGRRCIAYAGDVGQVEHCHEVVGRVMEAFGRLDILVNNAGEQHEVEDLAELSPEQLERTFRTNVYSFFFMTKAALPHLGRGSAIINSTSVTAYKGHETLIDYSATKGAIVAFTRTMSNVLVERGIRVNAVAPGPIWTPLIPASFDADHVAHHGESSPMGRVGQPNEVAPSYVFLASDDASYMSGQVLHPNGGMVVGS
ncbi:SDR family oxidoreductase [Amorphus coralli]|uniref:SDR family oxidoreductase n=1 Tax=Amorphus coralli TaxID=340680 RepID=UPI00038102CA|nr:SDR family oxidoreductase [Amorphus coralli]